MVCVDALAVKTLDVEAKLKNYENKMKTVLDDTLLFDHLCKILVHRRWSVLMHLLRRL